MVADRRDSLPDYADAAATLQRCGLPQSPAEAHGFALGLFVGEVADPRAVWQREWYSQFDPADVLAGECRVMLERVFAGVYSADRHMPLQLLLLLPDGIAADPARVSAVRDWCQGFLFGFGLGGKAVSARLSAEARELLHDFAEFTRLNTDDVENSAENQAALMEIEEYVRMGVMLIRDELAGGQEPYESE